MLTIVLVITVIAGLLYYAYNVGLEKGYEEALKVITVDDSGDYDLRNE